RLPGGIARRLAPDRPDPPADRGPGTCPLPDPGRGPAPLRADRYVGVRRTPGRTPMSAPARVIDLNADLGEGCPWDEALLDRVTSASICCGAHAGDPETIRRTLRMARARGVAVGAHPGFADREAFGRREQEMAPTEVQHLILAQWDDLAAWTDAEGVPLLFVK